MPATYTPGRTNFGLLPEPEGSVGPFIVSASINAAIVVTALIIGMTVKHVIEVHHYEMTGIDRSHNASPAAQGEGSAAAQTAASAKAAENRA